MMDLRQATLLLRQHNEWRRGVENLPMVCPTALGKAIDSICELAEELELELNEKQQKLATIHGKASASLQTSWLYSGKDRVESLLREIRDLSLENAPDVERREQPTTPSDG